MALAVVKRLPPQSPRESAILAYRIVDEDGAPLGAPAAWCLCHAPWEGPPAKRPRLCPEKPCYEADGYVRLPSGATETDEAKALREREAALAKP